MNLVKLFKDFFTAIKEKRDQGGYDWQTSQQIDNFENELKAADKVPQLHKDEPGYSNIREWAQNIILKRINKIVKKEFETFKDIGNTYLTEGKVDKNKVFEIVKKHPVTFILVWMYRGMVFDRKVVKNETSYTVSADFANKVASSKEVGAFIGNFLGQRDIENKPQAPHLIFNYLNPVIDMPKEFSIGPVFNETFKPNGKLVPTARLAALKNVIPQPSDPKKLEKLLSDSSKYEIIKNYLLTPDDEKNKFKFEKLEDEKEFIKTNILVIQAVLAKEHEIMKQNQDLMVIPEDIINKIPGAIAGFQSLFIIGKLDVSKLLGPDPFGHAIDILKGLNREQLKAHPNLPSTLIRFAILSLPEYRSVLNDFDVGYDKMLELTDILVKSPNSLFNLVSAIGDFQKDSKGKDGKPKAAAPEKTQALLVAGITLVAEISENQGFTTPENASLITNILTKFIRTTLINSELETKSEVSDDRLKVIDHQVELLSQLVIQNLQNKDALNDLKAMIESVEFKNLLAANGALSKAEDKNNPELQSKVAVAGLSLLATAGMQKVLTNSDNKKQIEEIVNVFLVAAIPEETKEGFYKGEKGTLSEAQKLEIVNKKVSPIIKLVMDNIQNPKVLGDIRSAVESKEFKQLLLVNNALIHKKKELEKGGVVAAEIPKKLIVEQNLVIIEGLNFLATEGMQAVFKTNEGNIRNIVENFLGSAIPEAIKNDLLDLITKNIKQDQLLILASVMSRPAALNLMQAFAHLDKEPTPKQQGDVLSNLLELMVSEDLQKFIKSNEEDVKNLIIKFLKGRMPAQMESLVSDLILNNLKNLNVLDALNSAIEKDFIPIAKAIDELDKLTKKQKSLEHVEPEALKKASDEVMVKCLNFINSDNMRVVFAVNDKQLKSFLTKTITDLKGAKEADVKEVVDYIMSIYSNEELFTKVVDAVEKEIRGTPLSSLDKISLATDLADSRIYTLYKVFTIEQTFSQRVAAAVYNISDKDKRNTLIATIDEAIKIEPAKSLSENEQFEEILAAFLKAKEDPIKVDDIRNASENLEAHIESLTSQICRHNTSLEESTVKSDITQVLLKEKVLTQQILLAGKEVLSSLNIENGSEFNKYFTAKQAKESFGAQVESFLSKFSLFSSTSISTSPTSAKVEEKTLNEITKSYYKTILTAQTLNR